MVVHSPWTIIRKINEGFQYVETLSDETAKYNYGFIFPYKDIIEKIETGHYINMIDD